MMNFGNSPLLDMGTNQQQPQMMDAELQKMYEAIQQKRASINMQAQQSQTPLWDEIDKIEDNLTGAQRQYLMQNQEYVNSLQYVSKLVQDEELRIIRPRIESTQQGQEALKKHLSLMQRLKATPNIRRLFPMLRITGKRAIINTARMRLMYFVLLQTY